MNEGAESLGAYVLPKILPGVWLDDEWRKQKNNFINLPQWKYCRKIRHVRWCGGIIIIAIIVKRFWFIGVFVVILSRFERDWHQNEREDRIYLLNDFFTWSFAARRKLYPVPILVYKRGISYIEAANNLTKIQFFRIKVVLFVKEIISSAITSPDWFLQGYKVTWSWSTDWRSGGGLVIRIEQEWFVRSTSRACPKSW